VQPTLNEYLQSTDNTYALWQVPSHVVSISEIVRWFCFENVCRRL